MEYDFEAASNRTKRKRRQDSQRTTVTKKPRLQEVIMLSDDEELTNGDTTSEDNSAMEEAIGRSFQISPKCICTGGEIIQAENVKQCVSLFETCILEYSIGENKGNLFCGGSTWVYGYYPTSSGTVFLVTIVMPDEKRTNSGREQNLCLLRFTMIFSSDIYSTVLQAICSTFPSITLRNVGAMTRTEDTQFAEEKKNLQTIFYYYLSKACYEQIYKVGSKQKEMGLSKIILVWPPPPCKDAVSLLNTDLSLLEPDEFLNDNIIDFYLKYIRYHIHGGGPSNFYYFNTFLYKMISEKSNFDTTSMLKWTGDDNIFEKDYIAIPINESLHWLLAIVCFAKDAVNHVPDTVGYRPVILLFDSMSSCSLTSKITKHIRKYLTNMWHYLNPDKHPGFTFTQTNLPVKRPKIPQQSNGSDCGVFLLHFMEKFSKKPTWKVETFEPHWFVEEEVTSKRKLIRDVIDALQRQQNS